MKEESEKSGLELNIQKIKITASSPITSWLIDGETMETARDFILGAPKSLQMVTAAMKLKDACSLEGKLWETFVFVQFLSRVWLFVTPWTAAGQAPLSSTVSRSFAQTQVYWAGGAVQPPHPLLSPFPPTFNPRQFWQTSVS